MMHPRPAADVERDLKAIGRAAPALLDTYRWLHQADAAKVRTGLPGGGRGKGGTGDPTGQAAVAMRALRGKVAAASAAVEAARAEVTAAVAALAEAQRALDGCLSDEFDPTDQQRREFRVVSKAELARAKRAKRRREGRGEGWGAA